MTFKPSISFLLLPLLAACAAPEGEDWPSVSFGHEVEATNEAIAARPEVTLAPLPSLPEDEKAGLNNPGTYVERVKRDYEALLENLEARGRDYQTARSGLSGVKNQDFADHWLSAQMELSNISQYTEELPRLRARLAALGDHSPEGAKTLLAQIEAEEMEKRLFLKNEKEFLARLEP